MADKNQDKNQSKNRAEQAEEHDESVLNPEIKNESDLSKKERRLSEVCNGASFAFFFMLLADFLSLRVT